MSARQERAAALVRAGAITPERACVHKGAYPNQNHAKHAARLAWEKTGRQMQTYKCPFCACYHIASVPYGEDES